MLVDDKLRITENAKNKTKQKKNKKNKQTNKQIKAGIVTRLSALDRVIILFNQEWYAGHEQIYHSVLYFTFSTQVKPKRMTSTNVRQPRQATSCIKMIGIGMCDIYEKY